MKISKLIEELKKAGDEHGDIECLIEVRTPEAEAEVNSILEEVSLVPVAELSFENRESHGNSIALLM